jgi:hypothetical protein
MINIILLIIILIIFIIILFYINKINIINKKNIISENFNNDNSCDNNIDNNILTPVQEDLCNNFYNNTQCALNIDNDNSCTCKFQKNNIKYSFDSPEFCCKKRCNKNGVNNCNTCNKNSIPYYCNIGGQCIEYQGTIMNSHISSNNCGTDPLNNQLLLPYASIEECKKSVDICDKYNDNANTVHSNRTNCLADTNCGYCTNDDGGGKCINGTISGPLDLNKYYYCTPYSKSKSNSYEYGNNAQYCL